jgi:PAS domain S-box-containing protein
MLNTYKTKQETGFGVVVAFSGGAASFVGLSALLGWITGLRALASIRSDFMPMSPDTALAFVILGLILLLHVRIHEQRKSNLFVSAIIAFVSIYGLLKSIEYFVNADLTFENILFPATEKIGSFFIKRMSPITGVLFFLSGIALQLRLLLGTRHKISNIISSLGVITLTIGFIATIGYVFGTPLLYGGAITPLAATTAIGFLLLGFGLVAVAGPKNIFLQLFVGDSASGRLLRIFLPMTILAVLVQGFFSETLTNVYGVNHAMAAALLSLAFAVLMSAVIVQLSKVIFRRADTAEAERKRAQEELKNSEERFRSVWESSIDGMRITDKEGTIVGVNDAYCTLVGARREDLEGQSFTIAYRSSDKEHQASTLQYKQKFSARTIVPKMEAALELRSGNALSVELSNAFLESGGNDPLLLTIFRDITERKRAEDALRESEYWFKESQKAGRIGSYFLDFKTGYWRSSEVLDELFGIDTKYERSIEGWMNLIHPEHRGEMVEYPKHIINNKIAFEKEYRIIRPSDGKERWVSGHGEFSFDEKGLPVSMIGTLQDITERKHLKLEILTVAGQMKMLFEKLDEVFWSVDVVNNVTLQMSPACEKLYGYLPKEFFKNPMLWYECIHPDDRHIVDEKNPDVFSGKSVQQEYRIVRDDGEIRWVEAKVKPTVDTAGKVVRLDGIVSDITDRKRAEEVLKQREQQLEEAQREAHLGSWEWKALTDVTTCSDELYSLFGKDSKEFKFSLQVFLEASHPDDHKAVENYVQQLFQTHNPAQFDYRVITAAGGIRWLHSRTTTTVEDTGRLVGMQGTVQDITERKRAEAANTLLAQTLKSAQDCISITDLNDKILFVNHAFVATYGFSEEDLIGKNIAMLRPTSISPLQVGEILPSTLKGHWHGELINRRKDGTEFPIELWTSVVNDGEGNPIAAVGVARDISERKKAEANLVTSEKRFRSIWDNSADGMRLTNSEGWIVEVNEAYCRMVNLTRDNLIGQLFSVVYKRGGMDDDLNLYVERFRNGKVGAQTSMTATLWDGRPIDLEISSSYIGIDGHDKMLLGIFRDTTARRKTEEKLAEQARLLDVALDAIIVRDMDERLLYWNRAAEKMFGWTFDEARMLDLQKFIKEDNWEKFKEAKKIFLSQGVWEGEFRQMTKEGREITTESHWTIVHDEEGRPTSRLIINHDVTKQKQLEEELTQIQKLESIGTLASGIAHDFNNILGIVLGYSSLIERIADDPEKLSQSVQSINAAVQRGASLVKQILTFARKADVIFGPIDVNVMIKEIVKMLRETFPKTIEMSLQLDRELPFIIADATQLHQVLLNMSVNARDAMPIGGILSFKTGIAKGSSLRNVFSDVQDGDYAHIIITDTGVGMDDTTRSHIFDPFFTTKEKGKGTGLGLSVVYGVMKNHYGFIDVQSEPGKGTTFNLYFPIPEESAHGTDRTVGDIEEIRGGTETILVVEDEEALLRMSKRILEGKGYHVLTAVDGLEALALYRKHKDEIALVVTDVGLPKISGDQLFFELKKVNPSVRVILVSGYIDPGIKSEIFKAGVHDFVQKPYDPNEVLKKVRESIDRK